MHSGRQRPASGGCLGRNPTEGLGFRGQSLEVRIEGLSGWGSPTLKFRCSYTAVEGFCCVDILLGV